MILYLSNQFNAFSRSMQWVAIKEKVNETSKQSNIWIEQYYGKTRQFDKQLGI